MLFFALLLGCPTPDGCRESDTPSAVLGFGETGYEATPDDGVVEIIYGVQGGYHLPVAIDAEGLASDELVVGSFVGVMDGVEVATSNPWLNFRCNPETGSQQAWNIQLIFDRDLLPADLHGQTLQIEGSLVDQRQVTVTVDGEVTMSDPESQ